MNDAATIVSIITVAAALFLAVRGLRSHQPGGKRTVMMAGAWIVIIAALAFLFDRLTP
jgi:FtsH-binding integral membrane protein